MHDTSNTLVFTTKSCGTAVHTPTTTMGYCLRQLQRETVTEHSSTQLVQMIHISIRHVDMEDVLVMRYERYNIIKNYFYLLIGINC